MYSPFLVPVDGSATSERGLREALTLAAPLHASLLLLHVVDDFPLQVEMASAANYDEVHRERVAEGQAILERGARLASEAGLACETVLREVKAVPVADVIVAEASSRHCGLVVMGTHGRRGLARMALGSDAERVLRHAPVPVLLIRRRDD